MQKSTSTTSTVKDLWWCGPVSIQLQYADISRCFEDNKTLLQDSTNKLKKGYHTFSMEDNKLYSKRGHETDRKYF